MDTAGLEGESSVEDEQALGNGRALEGAVRAGGRSYRTGDLAKGAVADVASRRSKVYMVEQVISVDAKLECETFDSHNLLHQVQVGVDVVGAIQGIAAKAAEVGLASVGNELGHIQAAFIDAGVRIA